MCHGYWRHVVSVWRLVKYVWLVQMGLRMLWKRRLTNEYTPQGGVWQVKASPRSGQDAFDASRKPKDGPEAASDEWIHAPGRVWQVKRSPRSGHKKAFEEWRWVQGGPTEAIVTQTRQDRHLDRSKVTKARQGRQFQASGTYRALDPLRGQNYVKSQEYD